MLCFFVLILTSQIFNVAAFTSIMKFIYSLNLNDAQNFALHIL